MRYDVVVVGGGHAGCEAAAAAARIGARTALVTLRRDDLGQMSCNPAIGGLGKGHLVREVDALDGLMGRAADMGGIQFRLLNRSKGPAVQGPRAQADRRAYGAAMAGLIDETAGLRVIEAEVGGLLIESGRVVGVETSAGELRAGSTVLTTGTFLAGMLHIGGRRTAGGRAGAPAAERLALQLRSLGLPMRRLKTGTPPRLDGRTIDWASVERQPGDDEPAMFSALSAAPALPQLPCGVTRTTAASHAIVREHLHRSALRLGALGGPGPRYCPSIEDKVERFGNRDGHQIYLEPEGLDDHLIYPNGLSTSLPADVQAALVASVPGLERAVIARPGYAIDYDHLDPRALGPGLALLTLPGLWCAGQINGTTGYEEAAAQGLVAGLNAARGAAGMTEAVFDRAESYVGVMIDDLVTQGVSEPYRMFTSRAEYRLRLRADNADLRLTPRGEALGLIGAKRARLFARRAAALAAVRALLEKLTASPAAARAGAAVRQDGVVRRAFEWLRFPEIGEAQERALWPELADVDRVIMVQLRTDARFSSYVERQDADVAAFRRDEALRLAADLDYAALPGLSREAAERLIAARPATLGAAGRVPGVTPGALTALLAHCRRAA